MTHSNKFSQFVPRNAWFVKRFMKNISYNFKKSCRLQLRVSPELLQLIHQVQVCSGMQLTVSDIVRAAVIEYCKGRTC